MFVKHVSCGEGVCLSVFYSLWCWFRPTDVLYCMYTIRRVGLNEKKVYNNNDDDVIILQISRVWICTCVVLTPVCRRRSLAEISLHAIDTHYLARSRDIFLFAFSAAMVGAHEALSDWDSNMILLNPSWNRVRTALYRVDVVLCRVKCDHRSVLCSCFAGNGDISGVELQRASLSVSQ